jgi:hypothetical protein
MMIEGLKERGEPRLILAGLGMDYVSQPAHCVIHVIHLDSTLLHEFIVAFKFYILVLYNV